MPTKTPYDPLTASASATATAIRSGRVSAREVVEAHLARIAAVNPTLNAVVDVAAAEARRDAEAADRALARGEAVGPLHGVPFTVKDWIEVAGRRCTAGMPQYADHVPSEDATVVARLRQAGGILLGKTNVMVDNPIYGRTNHPYRLGHSPAGSSSGEAAIIAAGGSPLGLGSDSGGSIRHPAHCCGIAGLKPTTGRVPLTGHLPFIGTLADPRTVIGPLARFVADLHLALALIAGPDGRDPSAVPVPLGSHEDVALPGLRGAYYTAHDGGGAPTKDTVRTVEDAVWALSEAGVVMEEALPERIEETYEITRAYWRRPESESPEEWSPPEGAFAPGHNALDGEASARLLFAWDRYRRAMLRFMARYDLVLTPAANRPALPHGQDEGGIPYTLAFSLTGYPAVVVRAGASEDGLPIGVQIVGRPWRDDVALAAAAAVEARLGPWQPPPL